MTVKKAPPAAMPPVQVRPANVTDAATLSTFARTSFIETFGAENTPEDMAVYLDSTFTPDQQAAEITDPKSVVLLALYGAQYSADSLIGYAHIIRGPTPQGITGANPIQLKQLYVAPEWHGRGVAHTLMTEVLHTARMRGAHTIWLGVWERNPRAIAFYRKYGFQHVGEHIFQLGTDAQTDWLMERSL